MGSFISNFKNYISELIVSFNSGNVKQINYGSLRITAIKEKYCYIKDTHLILNSLLCNYIVGDYS